MRKTKAARLLEMLQQGRKITSIEIIQELSTTTPRDLVYKLRKCGYDIRGEEKRNPSTGGRFLVFGLNKDRDKGE